MPIFVAKDLIDEMFRSKAIKPDLSYIETSIQKFINQLSSEYSVSPPKIAVMRSKNIREIFKAPLRASYFPQTRTILFNYESCHLVNLLHEFKHHLQTVKENRVLISEIIEGTKRGLKLYEIPCEVEAAEFAYYSLKKYLQEYKEKTKRSI